jgi:hypothetical protein
VSQPAHILGKALTADAKNRALRTFLVNLATDVLSAVVLLLTPIVSNATGWQDIDWKITGFLLAKTVVASAFSYLMRTVLDKSVIPTPLPPSPVPPPNDDAPEGDDFDPSKPLRGYGEGV